MATSSISFMTPVNTSKLPELQRLNSFQDSQEWWKTRSVLLQFQQKIERLEIILIELKNEVRLARTRPALKAKRRKR